MSMFVKIAAQRKEAGAKQVELETAKRGEASAARDREVQRKQRIAAILGAQSADAAARGVQLSGSVANISLEDAKRASRESLIDDVNTAGRVAALSRQIRSVGRLQKFRTAITIFNEAERVISRGSTSPASATQRGAPI